MIYEFYTPKKIVFVSVLLLLLLGSATVGYKILAEISWLDALYMSVITIATVGYRELIPYDPVIKAFTIFVIVSGLLVIGYSLSVLTEYLFSKNIFNQLINKKLQQKIDKLNGHIIVCDYGRNGRQAVAKLESLM